MATDFFEAAKGVKNKSDQWGRWKWGSFVISH
jgi:hypothetical protein